MKKLLYITNFEAPYRVPFYNALSKKYDMTLALSETIEEQNSRDKKWFSTHERGYHLIQMKPYNIGKLRICFEVRKLIKEKDIVFFNMYGNATNIYAMFCLRMMKKRFVLSVDGMLPKESESWFTRKLKSFLLTSPEFILSPGHSVDKLMIQYGVAQEKIKRYPFTPLTKTDIKEAQVVSDDDRRILRKKYHIKESTVLYCGDIPAEGLSEKQWDMVLTRAKEMEDTAFVLGDKTFFADRHEYKGESCIYIIPQTSEFQRLECFCMCDGFVNLFDQRINRSELAEFNYCPDIKRIISNCSKERLGIKEEFIVLMVGRPIYVKGLDVLIKATKYMDKRIGVYFVGGDVSDEYLKLKEECGANNIYFHGFKPKEEIKTYFQAADIFVLPTRGDVWGLVVNEALSFGLPVVTTNRCVAGLELIRDGENGYLVNVEDEKELGKCCSKLYNDEKLFNSMVENAYNSILMYNIDEMVKSHIEVFEQVSIEG